MNFLFNYILNLARTTLRREPIRPLIFSWYATHRCSLHCSYCSDGNGVPFKNDVCAELSLSDAKAMLKMLRKSGDTLDITGGEPLERDDLEEILGYAKQLGFRVILNTKGIGIENRPDIPEYCDVIALSIDSLSRSVIAKIIRAGDDIAGQILSALEFLLRNRKKFDIDLTLASVIMADTFPDILEVLNFAEKEKLAIAVSPRLHGTEVHHDLRNHPEYPSLITEFVRRKSRGVRVLGIFDYFEVIRDFSPYRCYPMLMPTIRPDGALYHPCLELGIAPTNILSGKSYESALFEAGKGKSAYPFCNASCHILCHAGLSLLQARPFCAVRELFSWRV